MKRALFFLILLAGLPSDVRSELFSTSTNFVQTLTINTGEAALLYKPLTPEKYPSATFLKDNTICQVRLSFTDQPLIVPGPLQIQFPNDSLVMEYQRLKTTNVHIAFFSTNNPVVFEVPARKTVTLQPLSWDNGWAYAAALVTISNTFTTAQAVVYNQGSFSGPFRCTIEPPINPADINSTKFPQGLICYYFTEEFAAVPPLQATTLPAGTAQVTIEKSHNLTNWFPVFMNTISDPQPAFYRFKATK